jgi:ubiquitin-protein ligase E3 A
LSLKIELSKHNNEDLKKELVISFEHEEAKDEGGVQKEWFQLIVKEIFDPKYGKCK